MPLPQHTYPKVILSLHLHRSPPQELLYNISNLGIDTKPYNGAREPSINRVGSRQSVEGQGWGSHAVLGAQPGMQREMSVKEGGRRSCASCRRFSHWHSCVVSQPQLYSFQSHQPWRWHNHSA